MAAPVHASSPVRIDQGTSILGLSPYFSPSSDKRFWSNLRNRIDHLLDERHGNITKGEDLTNPGPATKTHMNERAKRLKEDSLLLLRGFDSITHTLSQLSNNLDNALKGAKDLANPPTLTDIFHSHLNNPERSKEGSQNEENEEDSNKGLKRKYSSSHCSEDPVDDSQHGNERNLKDGKLKKAKNLAISMANKSASLARELKSIKLDLCFMQERCALLEAENRRLRDGFAKGIRPEEDDLVRLQLEALLAEKSRLASENANLTRENQCLHQLVEYHQLTSHNQELFDSDSASYEQVIQGICLDFTSPPPPIAQGSVVDDKDEASQTPQVKPSSRLF